MPPLLVPALHLIVLVGVGALSRSAAVVLLAAVAAGASVTLLTPLGELAAKPLPDLAIAFAGVGLGTVLGLWAAVARARARRAKPDARALALERARRRNGGSPWPLATTVIVIVVALGLYLEGRLVPAWRTTVNGWLDSPPAHAIGLSAPAAFPWDARPPASGAGPTPAASGGTTGSAAARAPTTARPQGDLRHCLDNTERGDVLRCAERGR
jgi:hypothetical protein